jgi:GWxTD domain-containing protein
MQISIVSGDKKNSIEKVIQVLPFSRESLSVSDIELATDIRKVKGETKFKRGGHQIIPNPERVFGGNRPILYLYSEIYNLKNNKKFTVAYSVLDSSGKLVVKYPEKVILAEKFNVPEIGGINVLGLKQGIYTLRIDVSQDDEKVEREKTFRVIKPVPRREQFLFTKEEKKYYSFIDYIATRRQLNFFVTLDSVGKERFLQHFWKLKGRDCLLMYIDRIRYVDLHYKRKTDRGRIYIKYGKPDEINRYPSSSLYRACEKWLYYGEGGKEFIFVDIQGVGSYELIYSSDKEEFTDPNYRRFIPPSLWPG